jgi:hypothetical protein
MNKIKRYTYGFAFILCMAALSSCISEVDVDIPEQFPKLVIGSFINPEDDGIAVLVTSSSPIFSQNENIDIHESLENATVVISDGTNEVTIPYDENRYLYYISMDEFTIHYGGTYTLEVNVSGYKTVTATTTVPLSTLDFDEAIVSDIDTNNQDYFDFIAYNFRFKWQDDPQESNLYRLYVTESNSGSYAITDKFITDEDREGEAITENGYVESYYFDQNASFDALLINCSEDYFKYHRSLQNVTYGDPFSEPAIIYSNVKNGLGCFGGYSSSFAHITP